MIEAGWVTLRPWQTDDTSFVFHACQDPDIQRWAEVPVPFTALDAATFVSTHARHQPEDVGVFLASTRTDSGEVLGSVGIAQIDWAMRTGVVATFWVAPEVRGAGVASISLDALARWAFHELELAELWMTCAPENDGGRRVAEKAGFALTAEEPGRLVLSRLAH
jgi:RimJ/RimL family protein N-acetyltransferase